MPYYIYQFLNASKQVLYVGQTINLYARFMEHKHSQPWWNKVRQIVAAPCNNQIDMILYELYYINLLQPKYNKASVYNVKPSLKIEPLNFISIHCKRDDKTNIIKGFRLKRTYKLLGMQKKSRNKTSLIFNPNTYVGKLILLLQEILNGSHTMHEVSKNCYAKSWIMDMIGYVKNRKKFYRIINHPLVQEFIQDHDIKIHVREIKI